MIANVRNRSSTSSSISSRFVYMRDLLFYYRSYKASLNNKASSIRVHNLIDLRALISIIVGMYWNSDGEVQVGWHGSIYSLKIY